MSHSQDTYIAPDGRTLKCMNDVIFVKPNPREMKSAGGIILTHDEHPHATGEILAFGVKTLKDGTQIPIPDIKVGDHIVYVKYLEEQHSNINIRDLFDGVIRVNLSDVILVCDDEADLDKIFK